MFDIDFCRRIEVTQVQNNTHTLAVFISFNVKMCFQFLTQTFISGLLKESS